MSEHDLTNKTKINIYKHYLLSTSMYGNETCTIIKLGQQRHLRNILKIKWN